MFNTKLSKALRIILNACQQWKQPFNSLIELDQHNYNVDGIEIEEKSCPQCQKTYRNQLDIFVPIHCRLFNYKITWKKWHLSKICKLAKTHAHSYRWETIQVRHLPKNIYTQSNLTSRHKHSTDTPPFECDICQHLHAKQPYFSPHANSYRWETIQL